jgi:hypothetical protein
MEGTTKHTPDLPLDRLIDLVRDSVESPPVTEEMCDKIMAGDAVLAYRLVPQPDLNPFGWNNETCMALHKVFKIALKMGKKCADDDLHHELYNAVQAAARLMDPNRSWGDGEVTAKDTMGAPDELPAAKATPSKTGISDPEQLTDTLQPLVSLLLKKRGLNVPRKWWTGSRTASSKEASAERMAWVGMALTGSGLSRTIAKARRARTPRARRATTTTTTTRGYRAPGRFARGEESSPDLQVTK